MLANLISSYIQNQSGSLGASQAAQAEAAAETTPKTASSESIDQAAYTLSNRAIMLSAVAQEFDVKGLKVSELGDLQTRLKEYSLIDQTGLSGLQVVYRAHQSSPDASTIDAENLLNEAMSEAKEKGASYSEFQTLGKLHRLFSNLASARH